MLICDKLILSVDYRVVTRLPLPEISYRAAEVEEMWCKLAEDFKSTLVREAGLAVKEIASVAITDMHGETQIKLTLPDGVIFLPYYMLSDIARAKASLLSALEYVDEVLSNREYAVKINLWWRLVSRGVPACLIEVSAVWSKVVISITVEKTVEPRGLVEQHLLKIQSVKQEILAAAKELLGISGELKITAIPQLSLEDWLEPIELEIELSKTGQRVRVYVQSERIRKLVEEYWSLVDELGQYTSTYEDVVENFGKVIAEELSSLFNTEFELRVDMF